MANNPLTSGPNVVSGAGENSSSSAGSPFLAEQQAIVDASYAADLAAGRAAEAAFAAGKRRPATDGSKPGIQVTYNAHGTPALGVPKGRGGKKGK